MAGRVPQGQALTQAHDSRFKAAFGGDWPWLVGIVLVTLAEFGWWTVSWLAGDAPAPWLFTYLGLGFAGLAVAIAVRFAVCRELPRASWSALIVGTALVGGGASLFLPLKFAIPSEIPFWLDVPLAEAERAMFGLNPWQWLDRYLGWAAVPLDRIYGLWLPLQLLILFSVMLVEPSRKKTRALVAYSLGWFLLGVVAAALLSSAGPIFYDRLMGTQDFQALNHMLDVRGATMALAESNAMWAAYHGNNPGLVAGISAAPSLHVAMSLWIVLAARSLAPRAMPVAIIYFVLITLGSIQLGWHYVSDGVLGSLGMLVIWALAGGIARRSGGLPAGRHH
ncbi:MAG: phosphatase PAP2 family protein [Croceibacterium sp.]